MSMIIVMERWKKHEEWSHSIEGLYGMQSVVCICMESTRVGFMVMQWAFKQHCHSLGIGLEFAVIFTGI